jgi:hypothetical protein
LLLAERCPLGPSTTDLIDGHVGADSEWSTPEEEEPGAFASRWKKLFSLESSNLMAMMDGVHPQSPLGEGFVEHDDCLLQIGDAYVLKFLISGDNVEALGEGRLLRREALLHLGTELGHLIENKFEVWIHSTKLFLLAVSVVDWVQSCAGSRLLIPLVSLSGSMSSKEQGIKESKTKNRKNRGRLGKYSLRGENQSVVCYKMIITHATAFLLTMWGHNPSNTKL